ncbi:MAG: imidazole glycerol phosphate synthase subunit HisF [Acidobacteriaceae bacterium]
MLTKRIIACLDVDAGRVVKGINFLHLCDAGDPAELAARHAESGADEIVLLDISATHKGRATLLDTVRRTAQQLFIPFTVGGGIRTVDDAARVFDCGADTVRINSAALATPSLITHIAQRYGSQAVIVAIDARRSEASPENAEVFSAGGRISTRRRLTGWITEAERRGAGEILLTSMDRDGTRSGFDLLLTSLAASLVQIPVIASGGAGAPEHFAEVLEPGCADAALAASIFHFGVHSAAELKHALAKSGIPVRL